ncbi:MAG TPA: response regulator [Candidatus Cloacimonadota bacterium]|nr:response regulator [Candidatus Cloacimonadota bacterium]
MTEKKNILIIDDDMISIHMGMMILKELEFEADHAENGQEALERLSQKQYDLILLDIMMPEMSGFDLAGHLKKILLLPISLSFSLLLSMIRLPLLKPSDWEAMNISVNHLTIWSFWSE